MKRSSWGWKRTAVALGLGALGVGTLASVGTAVSPSGTLAAAKQYPPGKVTLCHHTHSKRHPFVTINVSQRALPAHLRHGDTTGPCPATAPAEQKAAKTSRGKSNERAKKGSRRQGAPPGSSAGRAEHQLTGPQRYGARTRRHRAGPRRSASALRPPAWPRRPGTTAALPPRLPARPAPAAAHPAIRRARRTAAPRPATAALRRGRAAAHRATARRRDRAAHRPARARTSRREGPAPAGPSFLSGSRRRPSRAMSLRAPAGCTCRKPPAERRRDDHRGHNRRDRRGDRRDGADLRRDRAPRAGAARRHHLPTELA